MRDPFSVAGQTALITGGGTGLGWPRGFQPQKAVD